MTNLNRLGARPFKLTFPTSKLYAMFDISTTVLDDVYDLDLPRNNTEDLLYWTSITQDDDGTFLDYNDKPVPDEVIDELLDHMQAAVSHKTESNVYKRLVNTLEQCLDTFSDYQYEYFSEEAFKSYRGTATGIVDAKIDYDNTVLVVAPDIVHVINNCIAGVGRFDVDPNLEGETVQQYAKSRFGHLAHHWEIYGDRKPQVDFDNVEDFDRNYFFELVAETEQRYGLKLQ